MGQHGERVKQALLDAAEELFASKGVDAVSNRHIAEHTGSANHSAVAYHFGGRDELIRALIERHTDDTRRRRRELANLLVEEPDLRDLLGCLILPWTDQLASLPRPSWRARLVQQLKATPSEVELIAALSDPLVDELFQRAMELLSDIPVPVLVGRSWIMGRMVAEACAQYEARLEQDTMEPNWNGLAYFLIDACAGMFVAPVTSVGDFLSSRAAGTLS